MFNAIAFLRLSRKWRIALVIVVADSYGSVSPFQRVNTDERACDIPTDPNKFSNSREFSRLDEMRIAKTRSVRVLFSREIYRIRGCRRFSRSRSLLGCRCFAIFRPRRTARRAVLCISEMDLTRTKYDFEGIRDPRCVNGRGTVVCKFARTPDTCVCVCVCFIYGFRLERPRVERSCARCTCAA